jgi:oxygen-dependent protoporphyrinogen oxidase
VTGLTRDADSWVATGPDLRADHVILACPAWKTAAILETLCPEASRLLGGIEGAPLAVVATAYEGIEDPKGFGFLVPRRERIRSLGCLWSSSIYPNARAPEGRVLLRTMVGGALDPRAVDLPDDALQDIVANDLKRTMTLDATPIRTWIFRHRRGIPQYVVGHGKRLAAVARTLAPHEGIHLAGNSYRGVSLNAVLAEASAMWPVT